MPAKSRRVASRQSQLNQRRKKQNRGPRGIPTALGTRPNAENGDPDAQAPESTHAAPAVATVSRPTATAEHPSPVNRQANPTQRSTRREAPASGGYVAAEIKRILALAGAVVVVIVGLSFVV